MYCMVLVGSGSFTFLLRGYETSVHHRRILCNPQAALSKSSQQQYDPCIYCKALRRRYTIHCDMIGMAKLSEYSSSEEKKTLSLCTSSIVRQRC